MNMALEIKPKKREIKEHGIWPQHPDMKVVEEIRDPKPMDAGACDCPTIGKMVVASTTFPLLLGKC